MKRFDPEHLQNPFNCDRFYQALQDLNRNKGFIAADVYYFYFCRQKKGRPMDRPESINTNGGLKLGGSLNVS
jgi:hypothetical protein